MNKIAAIYRHCYKTQQNKLDVDLIKICQKPKIYELRTDLGARLKLWKAGC